MQNPESRAPGPVLVLAPSGRDAAVISGLLGQVGVATEVCGDLPDLVSNLRLRDAGAALIAQEALLRDIGALRQWIADQPPWSDFPFVLLSLRDLTARLDPQQPTQLAATLGNVTVLERPLHPVSLISAVGAAMRARSRQRETAELLAERERHAVALRTSEAKFHAIVDGMPQPIWTADAAGTPEFYNARWQEVTGVTPPVRTNPAAVSPEPFAWDELLHPDDHDHAAADWYAAVQSGVPFRSEFRLRTRDGSWRWFTGRALPVYDDMSGEIVRWFGSCTDIDNAVRAREALAKKGSKADFETVDALFDDGKQPPSAVKFLADSGKFEPGNYKTAGGLHGVSFGCGERTRGG